MNWIEYKGDDKQIVPGTLVKTEEGAIFLVGHVNELMGQCDCCKEYSITHYSNDLVQAISDLIQQASPPVSQ